MKFAWVAFCCSVFALPVDAQQIDVDRNIPAEFRSVGTYKLIKRVKVRDGKLFPVAISEVLYEIYTDGITVRCYGEESDAFTAFEVYRRDGIVVTRGGGLVETVPGIQPKTIVGDVLRQLCLTEQRMTLSRFPALSDIVEITYSERVYEKDQQ